ncbi:MAG: Gfo/Idh/MocA family oxidoreductase [Planctomycetes bacterium]|nr:Gfo/Idh/MocA family oxidoreductase [Planctomycetota bacterium]
MKRTTTQHSDLNPPVTRRRFIRALGGAAVGCTILPALGTSRAHGSVAPSNRINMALIGCGGMGRANLNGFLSKPDVQVLAVCDPDSNRRADAQKAVNTHYAKQAASGTYSGCDAYNDFREVLDRPDIDAVIQAAPDHWHALIAIAACKAGKDIYGEKPLARTIAEGRAMSDTVRRYARVFQTGSQQRSDARFRFACELVRNGRIGKVHTVRVGIPGGSTTGNHPPIPVPDGFDYDLWLGPAPWAPYCENRCHYNFRHILDYSGGKLCDWGAHHVDVAHWGLDRLASGPVTVEGVGEYPSDGLWDAVVNFHVTATYEDGVQIIVDNTFTQGVRFEGEDGWVFVSRSAIDASPKMLLRDTIGANEIHLHPSGDHRRNFLDCVKSRKQPAAPVEHAHRTITVAHLANMAMQLGRPIHWDPSTETIANDDTASRMRSRATRSPWTM